MPSSNFVKFDLWRQLQLLNKLTNSDSSKDPLRVLFKSLRQFHSRGEPSSPDVKVVALPRSIFWRLFFGLLPLPENKKKQQQQQSGSSQKSSPVVSSPTSDKKNLFAETSDDDEQEQQQEEQEDTQKQPQQQVKSAKAVFAESSDDDETTNNKNNKVKSPNSTENAAADGGNYNPTFIRNSIDAARQEYINWLKDEGRLAAVDALARENDPAAASPEMKKKLKFGSSKKKAASAGPRFGDDSSDSDDDDDDDDTADPLAGASGSKTKKKTASGTNSNTDDDNEGEEQDDNVDADPLAHANDPKWQKYFARKKEIELIDKDLNRLYFDNYDFFELPATRKMAKNILEASLDLKIVSSYSQGMHEVVGLILWVLEMDAVRFDVPDDSSSDDESDSDTKKKTATTAEVNPAKHLTAHVMSKKYIEHDAFIIYKQVIQTFSLGSWYDSHPAGSEENVTRVVDDIHSRRLLKADKPLHDHLKALDVPVATYGLRWLRLLFIREYPLSQAMKIWDVIFADFATDRANKKIWTSLAPEIALSMLLYMARALVASDHTDTLRRLMRFPPVEDVTMIYINAINRNYPPGNSSGAAVLRELIPPNDDGRPFSKERMDPEQVHQHSLFGQIVSAVSAAASAVQHSASEAANKTSTAVKSAIGASARAVFADSSSSDDDDDDDAKKNNKKQKHDDPLAQLANSAAATSVKKSNGGEQNQQQQQQSSSSSSSAMEVYALQQKMKLLGNRIDRIIIDKLDGSDSDDSSDDDDKNGEGKKQALTEAQIKAAIVELKKIKRELMNPASK